MAVDTASKRSAALSYGVAHRAGTRPPSGAVGAFERGALLGCYYIDAAAIAPNDGWIVGSRSRLGIPQDRARVWYGEGRQRVWIAPEKAEP